LGGTKIGEIALCNNGILFFDELPYFNKDVLEALREPLEDHAILVSRVNSKIKYDTKFLFISAMNPCPCGNLFSKTKECRCNELEINRYKNRLSAPFLDRIDLIVTMSEISIDDKPDIDSATMHKIVLKTFLAQKRRGQKEFNGKLSEEDIRKYCTLDSDCQIILDKAITQFSLSFRAINKLLKVARTIADIGQSENIQKEHLLEGLSFRRR
jgi:magnesium chelatase family protein